MHSINCGDDLVSAETTSPFHDREAHSVLEWTWRVTASAAATAHRQRSRQRRPRLWFPAGPSPAASCKIPRTGTGKLYRTATAISAVMSFIQVAGYWFRVPVRPCVPCVSRLPPVSFYRFSQVHPLPGYRPSCYRPKLCSWFSWFTSLHATGPGVWRLAVARGRCRGC